MGANGMRTGDIYEQLCQRIASQRDVIVLYEQFRFMCDFLSEAKRVVFSYVGNGAQIYVDGLDDKKWFNVIMDLIEFDIPTKTMVEFHEYLENGHIKNYIFTVKNKEVVRYEVTKTIASFSGKELQQLVQDGLKSNRIKTGKQTFTKLYDGVKKVQEDNLRKN